MKKEYFKPCLEVVDIETEIVLAVSTDRIPVGGSGIKPSASPEYHGIWF